MSFPRYSEYKDSNVDWFDLVPSHWSIEPCRSVFFERNERNDPLVNEDYLSLMANIGVLPYEEKGDIGNKKPEDLGKCKQVYEGDLVINSMNYGIGSYGLSKYRGVCSPVYIVLIPQRNKIEERFAFRILETKQFQKYAQSFGNGILEHRAAINWDILKIIGVPTPPITEQRLILKFLDDQTSKIDSLIAEQEKLIELLKEKRQLVISNTVTKGLDPSVKMKNSANLWLGIYPEHWKLGKLKHIKSNEANSFVDGPFGSNLKSEHFIENGSVFVIESNFATQGVLDENGLKTISSEHFESIKRSEVRAGDIVIAKIGAQYGKSSILPTLSKRAVVSGNSLKLTVNLDVCETDFVNHFITNLKSIGVIEDIVNATAQPALSLGEMNNLPMLIPPLVEQKMIVSHLNLKLGEFDSLILKANSTISLLQERRTSIISAAVTGQIDIRNITSELEVA